MPARDEPPTQEDLASGSLASDELTQVPGGRAEPSHTLLDEGERVGRYLILRKLGMGGMGSVYAAYDPELDRKVAIKLVHFRAGRSGEAGRSRLLREAQAMARVTHPNVATVHDVGTFRDQVYVAMEFIQGQTIAAWCASTRPGWEQVIEVFDAAGRGLAAAHAQGLVHRDFKPENVMVEDRTGRVVVLDFGLARGADAVDEVESSLSATNSALLSAEITRAGDLTGTPAYMSPEQFARGKVDALSDQFSFCVSLYEALYGERPFEGRTPTALVWAVTEGKVKDAPTGRDAAGRAVPAVPGWLRKIVLRGLSPKPTDRWPSIEALLAAIDGARPRRRRVAAWSLAAAALLAFAGGAAYLGSRTNLCTGAARQLDGVWDEPRRAEVIAHVESLGLPWFRRGFAHTLEVVDAYAQAWIAGHQDACEATNRRGEQSAQIMDLRMACLGRARLELEATTDRLRNLDAEGARHVHALVDGLPSLARCSDVAALSAEDAPVVDAATAAAAEELRPELARARAGVSLGERGVAEQLSAMDERVMQLEHPVLQAEYNALLGEALQLQGEAEAARARLERGLAIALGHDRPELAVELLDRLVRVTGGDLQQPRAAMVYARVIDGLGARAGLDPALARQARAALASAFDMAGDYEAAERTYREVLEGVPAQRVLERAHVLHGLAVVLETNGDLAGAEQVHREVIGLYESVLGEQHPSVADAYSSLGTTLMLQHRYDEAEAAQRHALEIDIAVFGEDHPSIAGSRSNLGATLGAAGKFAQAQAEMKKVLEIIGPEHPRTGLVLQNLGTLALDQKDFEEAERYYRAAVEQRAGTLGVDHPKTAIVHSTLGLALDGQGRYAEGESEHRTALALALSAHPEEHEMVSRARYRLGLNLVEQGRPAEAIELLEPALRHRSEHDPEPKLVAQTRFALARALWDARRDRRGAREQAERARAEYEAAGLRQAGEVAAWLRAHSD